jgi:hypothetical protein
MEEFLVVFVILSLFVWSSCFLEKSGGRDTHAVATTSTCCGKGKEKRGGAGVAVVPPPPPYTLHTLSIFTGSFFHTCLFPWMGYGLRIRTLNTPNTRKTQECIGGTKSQATHICTNNQRMGRSACLINFVRAPGFERVKG